MTKYRKKGGSERINVSTINEMAEKITNELKTNLEAKKITRGDVKKNVRLMSEAMPQIVSAMSDLLQKMQKGNDVEQKFAKKIIKNRSQLSNF